MLDSLPSSGTLRETAIGPAITAIPLGGLVLVDATLFYTPAQDSILTHTFDFHVVDNGGTANGGDDTSPAATVTLDITPVNDVPSFTKGANVTVLEDSAAYSAAWATGISAGPSDEAGQLLNFIVSNNNNSLFTLAGQPAVAANGTLSFTPAANANGSALVTVAIHDNGGTANGGVDTSTAQTFDITVTNENVTGSETTASITLTAE